MSKRLAAGYFRTLDDDKAELITLLLCYLERLIVVSHNDILARTIFDVVGDGDGIKTFSPGFLNSYRRPY